MWRCCSSSIRGSIVGVVMASSAGSILRWMRASQLLLFRLRAFRALVTGFAILGVAMRGGWLVGSLGAGAVIARSGTGAAYLMVAAGFLLGAVALLPAGAPSATVSANPASLGRSVLEFFAAMRTDRGLLVVMLLTAAAEMLGFSHQVLLPSLARDVLHAGPEGLGALNAARSVGGILR